MSALPKYYTILLHGVNEALAVLDQHNCAAAKEILLHAQQEAEGLYILVDDWLAENGEKAMQWEL